MKMKMFGTAAVVAATLGLSAAKAETLIFAEGLPPGHYLSRLVSEPLMACITEGTNGAIDFTYMPGGQLLKMTDGIDGLKNGLADIAFASVGAESANLPLTSALMLPGLSNSAVEGTTAWRKALDTGGVLAQELESQGVKPITVNILAPYQVISKSVLDEPAKWQGQKLRISGAALLMAVESLGGTPVNFAATEYYVAAQRGTVDGTVISFASVKPYSVHEISTHYSRNLSLGTSASLFSIRLEKFNALPEDQQQVILDCGLKFELSAAEAIDAEEANIAQEMTDLGHTVYEVPADKLPLFAEALQPVQDDFVTRLKGMGLPGEEALNEYKAALGM